MIIRKFKMNIGTISKNIFLLITLFTIMKIEKLQKYVIFFPVLFYL